MYTICTGGIRNLIIEKSLSQIEGDFSILRTNKLSAKKPIDYADLITICVFTSAMNSRTLVAGKMWSSFFQEVADKSKKIAEWARTATEEEINNFKVFGQMGEVKSYKTSVEEIQEWADNPITTMMPTGISVLTPLLLSVDLAIICTERSPGFITSDNPCVWEDPLSYTYSLSGFPGLISPTIEIYLPISPRQCLLFNRRGLTDYVFIDDINILQATRTISRINYQTRLHSDQYFVTNQEKILTSWFIQI